MISGQYCKLFRDATHGMPDGISLNAPYKFHWIKVVRVDGKQLYCKGADQEMKLKIRRERSGKEFVDLWINDPIFGMLCFRTYAFRGQESRG